LPDQAGGQPTCTGSCAGNWPAMIASGTISVGTGLNQADFTTVARTDGGGSQLKFKEYPLYHFSGDTAAGQTNGQGVGSKWFVVGADGEFIGH
jgi:Uncharacterized protein conserved in bacteria